MQIYFSLKILPLKIGRIEAVIKGLANSAQTGLNTHWVFTLSKISNERNANFIKRLD